MSKKDWKNLLKNRKNKKQKGKQQQKPKQQNFSTPVTQPPAKQTTGFLDDPPVTVQSTKTTSPQGQAQPQSMQTDKPASYQKTESRSSPTKLRISAYAWAKILFMRDRGDTEIAGYGVTTPGDPLGVIDFITVKQEADGASFDMDPDAHATFFDEMCDKGLQPWQFQRILLHTHPGNGPSPSGTDERCFVRSFGNCDWAVMFILAKQGAKYCRIRFSTAQGIKTEMELPVELDFGLPFQASDHEAWEAEYKANIHKISYAQSHYCGYGAAGTGYPGASGRSFPPYGLYDNEVPSTPKPNLTPIPPLVTKGNLPNGTLHQNNDGSEYVWDAEYKKWVFHANPKKEPAGFRGHLPPEEEEEDITPDKIPENRVPMWFYIKDMTIELQLEFLLECDIEPEYVELYYIYEDGKNAFAVQWENDVISTEWEEAEKTEFEFWQDDYWKLIDAWNNTPVTEKTHTTEEFVWEDTEKSSGFLDESGTLPSADDMSDDELEALINGEEAAPKPPVELTTPTEEKPK